MIYTIYILNKSGGLIYNHDHSIPKIESEIKVNEYPLNLVLDYDKKRTAVLFGHNLSNVNAGHILVSINGNTVNGNVLEDGREVKEIIENKDSYPLALRFCRPKMTTNEKIFLASMFYPLFTIASQLSPEVKSSGISELEADTFKLHCFQTMTGKLRDIPILFKFLNFFYFLGVKFMVVAEPLQSGLDVVLKKIYELYADFVLKNPFYSLEMPIRCELFESNLQSLLDTIEKNGVANL